MIGQQDLRLHTMDDENAATKKRKPNWDTAYSNISLADAEKRLGFRIDDVKAVLVERMLAGFKSQELGGDKTKEEVYKGIMKYIKIEGYPTEAVPEFNAWFLLLSARYYSTLYATRNVIYDCSERKRSFPSMGRWGARRNPL